MADPESKKITQLNWRIKYLSKNKIVEKITIEKYKLLIEKHNNLCGICKNEETYISKKTGKPRPLCIDHHHDTGKLRGLLCSRCNHVLGHFNDSIELLESAINYLKNYY